MTSYKGLAEPHFKEVFEAIDECCATSSLNYYLIGARAINLEMLKNGIKPIRVTLDIDFAVVVSSLDQYNSLKAELLQKGFTQGVRPFQLNHKSDTIIDLLPCGEIENNNMVKFQERHEEINVLGFKQIEAHTIEHSIPSGIINVAPLQGIFILKMIAYEDTEHDRTKDLDDIQHMIHQYFDLHTDRIYEELNHIMETIPANEFQLLAGARTLGIDVKEILKSSPEVEQYIFKIINRELNSSLGSIASYFVQKRYFQNVEQVRRIFTEIKTGMTDG